MKTEKGAGEDGMTIEREKAGGEPAIKNITALFRQIIENESSREVRVCYRERSQERPCKLSANEHTIANF